MHQILNARFWVPAWPLVELFNGSKFAITRDSALVKRFARSIINKRREQLAQAAKLTGHAADADGADGDSSHLHQDLLLLFMESKGPDGKPLNDKQLVDTVLNFIIAGRDTTAQVRAQRQ
jgi:fatty acid omega-hydroxylase